MLVNFMLSLELMWKGMLGIFAVILVITLVVWLLAKMDKQASKKK